MQTLKTLAAATLVALAPAFALAQTTTTPAPATGAAPPAAKGEPGKGPHGQHRGERLKAADKDGDGAISKAEADAAGMKGLSANFDKLDANKDGKVTREEMRAGRLAHKGDHKGHMHHGEGKGPAATPATPATPPATK
jgi:hypothetical protein